MSQKCIYWIKYPLTIDFWNNFEQNFAKAFATTLLNKLLKKYKKFLQIIIKNKTDSLVSLWWQRDGLRAIDKQTQTTHIEERMLNIINIFFWIKNYIELHYE